MCKKCFLHFYFVYRIKCLTEIYEQKYCIYSFDYSMNSQNLRRWFLKKKKTFWFSLRIFSASGRTQLRSRALQTFAAIAVKIIPLYFFSPVHWSFRIHQQRGKITSKKVSDMTLNHKMVRLQSWISRECGVFPGSPRSGVVESYRVLSISQIELFDDLTV